MRIDIHSSFYSHLISSIDWTSTIVRLEKGYLIVRKAAIIQERIKLGFSGINITSHKATKIICFIPASDIFLYKLNFVYYPSNIEAPFRAYDWRRNLWDFSPEYLLKLVLFNYFFLPQIKIKNVIKAIMSYKVPRPDT